MLILTGYVLLVLNSNRPLIVFNIVLLELLYSNPGPANSTRGKDDPKTKNPRVQELPPSNFNKLNVKSLVDFQQHFKK